MRVVFVGGAGAMGSRAVRTAAEFDEFTELVIADFNAAAAESLAAELGPRVSAVKFDADRDDPRQLFSGAWGVLSSLGPYTRFGTKIMKAAIESGCQYVDINDDWEPTLQAFELDEAAKAADVTALIGMGASPGVSNVLAAKAAAQLDEVHELLTGWALVGIASDAGSDRPQAAMLHVVHQCTGIIRAVENGEYVDVAPLQTLPIHYPGIGDVVVRTIGHPEAVTLPRTYPGLQRCVNVMSGPDWYFDYVTDLMDGVESGRITADHAAVAMDRTPPRPTDAPRTRRLPPVFAWARGTRDGAETIAAAGITRWAPGKMAGATAVPAAVALRLLARGDVSLRGVVTPEAAVPAEEFFAALDPHYTEPAGSESSLVELVTTQAVPS
ncbi:saccharopine dehydrogenase family protein [Rhodococcus jostii]|uniref:saccharopine dehydrogenase family protein n=1 Tax=Rhodococcus jostii TaxID=132919 RepID=UPI00363376DF